MPRRPPMTRPSASLPRLTADHPRPPRLDAPSSRNVTSAKRQLKPCRGSAPPPSRLSSRPFRITILMDGREHGSSVGRVIFWAGSYLQVCSLRTAKWRQGRRDRRSRRLCPIEDRHKLDSSREGMLEGFSLGSYLMLVDYTGRLFRDGQGSTRPASARLHFPVRPQRWRTCRDVRDTIRRLRTTVFAFLTPFYFLNAGMKVNAVAVGVSLVLIVILLAVKLITKTIGVWPLTRLFRFGFRESAYTTLLMSTGLTFGTISALFGLTHGYTDLAGTYHTYINQEQYSILVTVVIGSAIVPTLIAQRFFRPEIEPVVALEVGPRAPWARSPAPVSRWGPNRDRPDCVRSSELFWRPRDWQVRSKGTSHVRQDSGGHRRLASQRESAGRGHRRGASLSVRASGYRGGRGAGSRRHDGRGRRAAPWRRGSLPPDRRGGGGIRSEPRCQPLFRRRAGPRRGRASSGSPRANRSVWWSSATTDTRGSPGSSSEAPATG